MFADLHPQFQPWAKWLYDVAEYNGLRPRVTSTFRSVAHQERLYAGYLRGEAPYPVARPGCSQHQYGVAIDMVVERAAELGALWQSYGLYWAGARDPVHFGIQWFPCR